MNLDPSLFTQNSATGAMPMGDVEELRKALEAGYGTDMSTLTGGAALRIQSLDATMQATLADNSHFALFNALPKPKAGATVDEWTEATDQGGWAGSTANSETGAIAQSQGTYARRVGMVKYLMTQCQVSFVQTLQNAIADAEAIENQMGTLRILRDVEHLNFYGDSSVVPTEFDGIVTQMNSLGSADHVIDAGGASLTSGSSIEHIANAAAVIAGYGNFGKPTDLFLPPSVGADMDTNIDPAYRVPLSTGQLSTLGTPVRGIVTAHGDVKLHRDVFIQDERMQAPFEIQFPVQAAANTFTPASITADASVSDTASQFVTATAGNYYYAVAGINGAGQSVIVKSTQTAVAAGKKVTLTITASVAGTETGYAIYRGRLNGTNATSDFRLMARVPKGGATTTFVDRNREIPGTTKAFLLNLTPGHTAITWRSLLPLIKFPLYPTNAAIVPWALLMFGYLRISKRRHHAVIKNIVPSSASWKPFV
jgi:hypothetical protein